MSEKSNQKNFYRYRSNIDSHSEYNIFSELEKQEIYCASKDELNDPMEGSKNVFWEGDNIIWENLIRHYLLSLLWAFEGYILCENKSKIGEECIHPLLTPDNLNTEQYKNFYTDFCNKVFQQEEIKNLPKDLEKFGKVGKYQLISIFTFIHNPVFSILWEEASIRNLAPKINFNKKADTSKGNISSEYLNLLKKTRVDYPDQNVVEIICNCVQNVSEEIYFNNKINRNSDDYAFENCSFITARFPGLYVDRLIESGLYPNNYVAGFSSKNNNCSMWGHYANGHKGICLQFNLCENGLLAKHELYKVKYGKDFPKINFFENMGRFPFPIMEKYWWTKNGNYSKVMKHIYKNEEEWRKKHWEHFVKYNTFKHDDWEYEDEWRLMRYTSLGGELSEEQRKIHYDFSELTGIIFGMRTDYEDMRKIIEIIEQKCNECERLDFKFFKAIFPEYGDKMRIEPLKLRW